MTTKDPRRNHGDSSAGGGQVRCLNEDKSERKVPIYGVSRSVPGGGTIGLVRDVTIDPVMKNAMVKIKEIIAVSAACSLASSCGMPVDENCCQQRGPPGSRNVANTRVPELLSA